MLMLKDTHQSSMWIAFTLGIVCVGSVVWSGCTTTVESNLGAPIKDRNDRDAVGTHHDAHEDEEVAQEPTDIVEDVSFSNPDTPEDTPEPPIDALADAVDDISMGEDTFSQPDAENPPPGPPNPIPNKFGIGLVGPGSTQQLDLTAELAGPGGHIKLIFPNITRDTQGPEQGWVDAVRGAYDRDLVPVIRMGPPWGDRYVRDQSDDPQHLQYGGLCTAYRRVTEGLPMRDGWPLWIEIHNEANLCYEWACRPGSVEGNWIEYQQTAREYASMVRDCADAIHGIGDSRIGVMIGGLAPGGTVSCQCGGDGFNPGITALEFMQAMRDGVPDVFEKLDGWATHSYPASNHGYGFFVPFEQSRPGLLFFEEELRLIGRDLPVFITETGWSSDFGSRDQIADWTASSYREVWLPDDRVRAVMPFQLQDGGWESFSWVDGGGNPYPVFGRVRDLRQSLP